MQIHKPNFYTYRHIRPDTGEIFYLGKGKGNRLNQKYCRNRHWKFVVEKNNGNFIAEVLETFNDENDAYQSEKELIEIGKELNYPLVNIAVGGKGIGSGKAHPSFGKKQSIDHISKRIRCGQKSSEQTKQKQSKAWKFTEKRKQQTLKLSQLLTGKKQSKSTIKKRTGEKSKLFKGYILATEILNPKNQILLIGTLDIAAHGFCHRQVYNCVNGKRKTHKKFTFVRKQIIPNS